MKNKARDKEIKVNVCWETADERKCHTFNKNEAYALKTAIENDGGTVWWFSPVEWSLFRKQTVLDKQYGLVVDGVVGAFRQLGEKIYDQLLDLCGIQECKQDRTN